MYRLNHILLALFAVILSTAHLEAQSWFEDGLSLQFHRERRETFRQLMPDNSIAILFNSPVKMRSNDTEFDYRPDSDFYYLTGFREPNAALILFKSPQDFNGVLTDEIIYVQPKEPAIEQWVGERMGIDGVRLKLGFEQVYLNKDFLQSPEIDFTQFSTAMYFEQLPIEGGEHNETLIRMVEALNQNSPFPATFADRSLHYLMDVMRVKKTEEELKLMRKAIAISGQAHIEAIKSIQQGVSERAIQGVHEFVHSSMGAENVSYTSIVGSGNNTTILHYVYNSVPNLQDGLVLMDVGAEYRGYSGDITRTVPVKGVFSQEEKAIYEVVLKALNAGINACRVGSSINQVEQSARSIIDRGLVDLGIIKGYEDHSYFPHGIGHFLGLDVHDRGAYGIFEPGMVITVEPGIYIPEGSDCDPKWWKIGIRIEDNILITEKGHENLSADVPKTIHEIEELMKQEGILQKLMSK